MEHFDEGVVADAVIGFVPGPVVDRNLGLGAGEALFVKRLDAAQLDGKHLQFASEGLLHDFLDAFDGLIAGVDRVASLRRTAFDHEQIFLASSVATNALRTLSIGILSASSRAKLTLEPPVKSMSNSAAAIVGGRHSDRDQQRRTGRAT